MAVVAAGPDPRDDMLAKFFAKASEVDTSGPAFKNMPNGGQPASLTAKLVELQVHGSDEVVTIPCVTSTKISEMKEMLVAKFGLETSAIYFFAKQGCATRKFQEHEECPRKCFIKGLDSLKRKMKQYEHPLAIIGSGHIGLRQGLWMLKKKCTNFVIFDRRHKVGGTSWIAQANPTSKLQTELGSYHLQYDEDNPVPTNLPPWPTRDQLLMHFDQVTREYGLYPYIKLNTNVLSIDIVGTKPETWSYNLTIHDIPPGSYTQAVGDPQKIKGSEREMMVDMVHMYPGNLSCPKKEEYKGEDTFGGTMEYAICGDMDYSKVTGKDVLILGHGAFGVENIRTCSEYDCKQIYLLCRRKNLACPRVVSWFINQSYSMLPGSLVMKSFGPAYDMLGFDPWSYHSVYSNAARTNVSVQQKSRFGIGDVYFIAVYMGKCKVIEDTVKRFTEKTCHLQNGGTISCEVVLKLFGFAGAWEVDRLLKIKEMYGWWPNADGRRHVFAEPIGVNATSFAGTSLSAAAMATVELASHMVWYPSDFHKLKVSESLPKRKGEPEADRPAYVVDARNSVGIAFIAPTFCPEMIDRGGQPNIMFLKHNKQWECHPMELYLEQCAAEWAEYGKKWKAAMPELKDVPPYPYTPKIVQGYLDEEFKNVKEAFGKGGVVAAHF
mmetsp:Transcript_109510/g.194152  ORF Transcript_109510/g.194152 Transcript_109510/m.194152 type:complete len:662 (+) Transcript_109510:65-2050(+)